MMVAKIIKEILIFFAVVAVMSFIQHPDMGVERIKLMFSMGNFLHPFLWSILPYFLLVGLRLFLWIVIKSVRKKED